MSDLDEILTLTSNQINRVFYLDNESDTVKKQARISKLENLGLWAEEVTRPERLKVVPSYSLVITTPVYIDNIFRVTDVEKNPNVVGILILVENDFVRNYVNLTKNRKVIDVYSNFEEVYSYIIMAVRSADIRSDFTKRSSTRARSA